ncbi:MAG: ferrochelatase [Bacteroidota bacterium]
MDYKKRGVLLVNLGSPESPSTKDVRVYLREFLMDERVIDVPYLLRKFLIECIILPTRPKKSAEAYRSIWWDEGSPLIVLSERLKARLQPKVQSDIELGMRYGKMSIESGIDKLVKRNPGIETIHLVPLYPHYAMSSYETVVVKAEEIMAEKYPELRLETLAPFYKDESYISALSKSIEKHLEADYDHILFSYHGIPERHVKKSDVTGEHCLKCENCCEVKSEAHANCYRHQVFETTKAVAKQLHLDPDKFSVSFQSRLGKDPWLRPFTDKEIIRFAEEGKKKLVIVCPAFVSDCLETIEEIGMEAKHEFLEAGGEQFTLVPCLNTDEQWVDTLANWCNQAK